MKSRKLLLLATALLSAGSLAAQSGTVRLHVADRTTHEAVTGAVAAFAPRSGRATVYAASNIDGTLAQTLPYDTYDLTITSLGYDSLGTIFRLAARTLTLDTLWLAPRTEAIDQVVVEVPALRTSIRGDTLSYRASAYKVAFGSDAEALITKMPGLEVAEGAVAAQGRTVQRIYVDGREFFGNDVMSALRNIPADMIESINVYNSQGDQSEFTGVDTGEGYTALNIVTLPDKRRGAFGRLFAGYGIPDKYIGGGNVNIFNQDRRISIVGLVNNVNRQNFSFEDILGTTDDATTKASANNFMVRPLDGVSTVQAVGLNYSDNWGKKVKITASYFFNRNDNHNVSTSDKQTFTASDKLVLYDDQARSHTLNVNHRFSSRIDYKIDKNHSMMMRTALSTQDNTFRSATFSRTDNRFSEDDIRFVNRRRTFAHNLTDGINFSNSLIYRYRLPGKTWHNLTLGAGGGYRSYEQRQLPRQYTFRDPDNLVCDTADYSSRTLSRIGRDQPGYDVNGYATYTRAFGKRMRGSVEYRCNYTHNSVDRMTFVFDDKTGLYPPERDPRQSTDYAYSYLTHRAGLSYQYLFRKTKVAASGYYQHTDFGSDYRFPYDSRNRASFNNLTYSLTSTIHIDARNLLKFDATGRTTNPRATDLQQIVNKTNRQNIFAGNPALRPVYTHRMAGQYIRSNPAKGRTLTLSAEFSASPNSIADSLVIDTPGFVVDIVDGKEELLGDGNQYIKPVNLSGFRNIKAGVNYGFPVRWLRSNLNLRTGISASRMPSIINGERNTLTNNVYNAGLTLGSNISESIDFRIGYTGYYNDSRSRSQVRTLDNTYFSQYIHGEATFVAWGRIVLRANADYNDYRGLTNDFHEQRLICNAQVGCRVLKSLGEVSIGVNDLLDRNGTTFRRTVSGTTLRNITNSGIGRYVSFQFSYNLRVYRRQSNAVLESLRNAE